MNGRSSADEMIFRTIACFSDDGVLDIDELDQIMRIALRDGIVDDEERRVLKNIIYNLTSRDLTPEMWRRVEQLVKRYHLDEVG